MTKEQYASFPETFQRDLTFRQLYEFLKGHKELAWNDHKYHNLLPYVKFVKTQYF